MPDISDEVDPRIKQLSYSSLLTLHACPRKYQLYRLNSEKKDTDTDGLGAVTLNFGGIVGEGIQHILKGNSLDNTIFHIFCLWKQDLLINDIKRKKSFWDAVIAVEKFSYLLSQNILDGYELAYLNGKPACELGFRIHLPQDYKYRGFVDAVLHNPTTKEVLVLEVKTSSVSSLNAAMYKNSFQAVGYSVVLDHLFPDLSSYNVRYLVYLTKSREYEILDFYKSYLSRAQWLVELSLEVSTINLYESEGIYPSRGESCFNFYRECEYFGTCSLSTSRLTSPISQEELDRIDQEVYDVEVTLESLIETQLSKSS